MDQQTNEVITVKQEKEEFDLFQWIQDFTDKLTVKRILTVLLTGFLITFLTLTFENRDLVFKTIYASITGGDQPAAWEVSRTTQDKLTELVAQSAIIKMAMVTEVDLQKNRRIVRYWHLDDQDEQAVRLKSATLLPQAVFDYDPKNTQQMVAILNNEFVCSHFQDTVYQRFFPDLAKRMPVICRVAIPPFYGRFVGILTVGLSSAPTKQEYDSLRIEVSRIAVEVYLRDVVKKPAPK